LVPSNTLALRVPPSVPRVKRPLSSRLARFVLRVLRWRVTGDLPDLTKFVIIVAPHTSNWDFVIGFLCYLALELRASWLGKHTIFRFPFGPVLRHFGGIPVDRGAAQDVVQRAVAEFQRRSSFVLALAPEGTRRRVATWRSGFYRIALGAGVPITTASLDFRKREVAVGPLFQPTGDYATDFQRIVDRFASVTPKRPELYEPAPSL
jgi:1-acyl-sn-glycerol-3-phosphate acyltransferase